PIDSTGGTEASIWPRFVAETHGPKWPCARVSTRWAFGTGCMYVGCPADQTLYFHSTELLCSCMDASGTVTKIASSPTAQNLELPSGQPSSGATSYVMRSTSKRSRECDGAY